MRFKPPKFLRTLLPELVWDLSSARGGGAAKTIFPAGDVGQSVFTPDRAAVYLTFDDGPTPGVTEWILDELARHGAKATFFCLGRNVERHPELYARILAEGHAVGNHTHNHMRGWGSSAKRYASDVVTAERVIDSRLFRPPYGRISPRKARLLGSRFRIVMWNIISRDYNPRLSPQRCLNNVIEHVKPGDIVVFHDSEKAFRNMSFALPKTLNHLRDNAMQSCKIEL